jgi:DNA topoisomerase I
MPRLRKTSPEDPGWTRRRAGMGFVYLDEAGKRLSARRAQRIKDLVIPPAGGSTSTTPTGAPAATPPSTTACSSSGGR